MKKILSLAIILSCALTSVSWADGPGGNNRGQQQVWQQDAGRGGPDGNRQQGPGKGRRPTIIRVTTITVARRAVIRGRRVTLIRSAMSGTISRGTAMIFAKVSRLRNVIAAMITG
ncbi:membrane protein [Klebsiella michiganensis]|uniref:Membrane protein n=1 Tax=Klebsiella michiganensis TaxID=1134687 RepID=A0A7H4LY20_9ENTR|nr:membrane protein [Klebsiella michiganensis]